MNGLPVVITKLFKVTWFFRFSVHKHGGNNKWSNLWFLVDGVRVAWSEEYDEHDGAIIDMATITLQLSGNGPVPELGVFFCPSKLNCYN